MHLVRLDKQSVDLIAASHAIPTICEAMQQAIYNALDARASTLHVTLDLGNRSFSVADNGEGIPSEGLYELIGETHASSKCNFLCHSEAQESDTKEKSHSDSFSSETVGSQYGFKGEFLVMLAAIGHVEITSRRKGAWSTFKKVIKHGVVEYNSRTTTTRTSYGTTLVVTDLFANLSLRKRELEQNKKHRQRMLETIRSFCWNLSLIWPAVSIQVVDKSTSTRVFHTPGTVNCRERFQLAFGNTLGESLQYVSYETNHGSFSVHGYMSLVQDEQMEFLEVNSQSFKQARASYQYAFFDHQWIYSFHSEVAKTLNQMALTLEAGIPVFVLIIRCSEAQFDLVQETGEKHVLLRSPESFMQFLRNFLRFCYNHRAKARTTARNVKDNAVSIQGSDMIQLPATQTDPVDSSSTVEDSIVTVQEEQMDQRFDPSDTQPARHPKINHREFENTMSHLVAGDDQHYPLSFTCRECGSVNLTSPASQKSEQTSEHLDQNAQDRLITQEVAVSPQVHTSVVEQTFESVFFASTRAMWRTEAKDPTTGLLEEALVARHKQPWSSSYCVEGFKRLVDKDHSRLNQHLAFASTEQNDQVNGEKPESTYFQQGHVVDDASRIKTITRQAKHLLTNLTLPKDVRRCSSIPDSRACRVTKQMLQEARVVRQVDKKFVLVVMPQHLKQDSDSHGEHDARSNETPADLLICIDQHAADERVQLEELEDGMFGSNGNERNVEVELNDPPQRLMVCAKEIGVLSAFGEVVRDWGFEFDIIEDEGEQGASLNQFTRVACEEDNYKARMVQLKSFPRVDRRVANAEDFREYLRLIAERSIHQWSSIPEIRPPVITRFLHSRACRSAIMFGDSLSLFHCQELINGLKRCRLPFQCAHGRPSIAPLVELSPSPSSCSTSTESK